MSDYETNEEMIDRLEEKAEKGDTSAKFWLFFIGVWALVGILGFITSLVCFFYDGTTTDKFVGLLTSIVLGPIYWFFYAFSDHYCTSSEKQTAGQQQQSVVVVQKKTSSVKKPSSKKSQKLNEILFKPNKSKSATKKK